jgi:hypothetical protein
MLSGTYSSLQYLLGYKLLFRTYSEFGFQLTIMPDHNFESPNKGYLRRARFVFAVLGGLYLLTVTLLSIPFLQTQLVVQVLLPDCAVFRLIHVIELPVSCI